MIPEVEIVGMSSCDFPSMLCRQRPKLINWPLEYTQSTIQINLQLLQNLLR